MRLHRILLELVLCFVPFVFRECYYTHDLLCNAESDTMGDSISILTFNSRKRGLMQLPGYLGSLVSNPSAKKFDIHLIVDAHGFMLIRDCYENLSKHFMRLTIRKLQEFNDSAPFKHYQSYFQTGILEPGQNDTNRLQRYHTGILKLDMVNILPDGVNKLIILDIDMLVLEDLKNLISETDRIERKNATATTYLFMTAENYQNDSYYTGKYGNRKEHFYPPYGLNSGLIVANLKQMRESNMTADYFLGIEDEFPKLADQDVLNTWAYYNQDKVGMLLYISSSVMNSLFHKGELPCKWNTRAHVMCYNPSVLFDSSRRDRGIFHGNTKNGVSPFLMEPTPEFQDIQILHKNFSSLFFQICPIHEYAFNHFVKLAKYAPDIKIYDK